MSDYVHRAIKSAAAHRLGQWRPGHHPILYHRVLQHIPGKHLEHIMNANKQSLAKSLHDEHAKGGNQMRKALEGVVHSVHAGGALNLAKFGRFVNEIANPVASAKHAINDFRQVSDNPRKMFSSPKEFARGSLNLYGANWRVGQAKLQTLNAMAPEFTGIIAPATGLHKLVAENVEGLAKTL